MQFKLILILALINLSTQNSFQESFQENIVCSECIKEIDPTLQKENTEFIQIALNYAHNKCKNSWAKDVCDGLIDRQMGPPIEEVVRNKYLNATRFCQNIHLCPHHNQILKLENYIEDVLKDKPQTASNKTADSNGSILKVLHLSDPHIDLFYQEDQPISCKRPVCCRDYGSQSEKQIQQGANLSGHWGSQGDCDLPNRTLEQFVLYVRDYVKPTFILWTGDNIAHDLENQYQNNQSIPTKTITDTLQNIIPDIPVYPIYGNHENFPVNVYMYNSSQPESWLNQEMAEIWKNWLDKDAYDMLYNNGYYAMRVTQYNLRIIAVNTAACDTENWYLFENPTDPGDQLAWMRTQLYEAEKNDESVYIIGHIDPGNSDCAELWGQRYNVLVDRFENIIVGQFFGHTHKDHFEVIRSTQGDKHAVGSIFISPSLTTYGVKNPSFKVFQVDSSSMKPFNWYTYSLNLTQANEQKNTTLYWQNSIFLIYSNRDITYNALSEFKMNNISSRGVAELQERFLLSNETLALYLFHKTTGVQPYENYLDNINTIPNYRERQYCEIMGNYHEQFECLAGTVTKGDWSNKLTNILMGQWRNVTK